MPQTICAQGFLLLLQKLRVIFLQVVVMYNASWGGFDVGLYQALVLYLSSLKLPRHFGQRDRDKIRKMSQGFFVHEGKLYKKGVAHISRFALLESIQS